MHHDKQKGKLAVMRIVECLKNKLVSQTRLHSVDCRTKRTIRHSLVVKTALSQAQLLWNAADMAVSFIKLTCGGAYF